MEEVSDIIDCRCLVQTAGELFRPVSAEEIKTVLFTLPSNKASGPDIYPAEIYKTAWTVVGKDFITVVRSFFLTGFMPESINSTRLTLAPKHSDATKMSEYRPIVCCNLIYKVISKVIPNRLKSSLPSTIENILLATEFLKDYHKSDISSRCASKLDIVKAFDTIQWPFIVSILRAMNYHDLFIHWVYMCVSTTSFTVYINGELEGFFTSARGV